MSLELERTHSWWHRAETPMERVRPSDRAPGWLRLMRAAYQGEASPVPYDPRSNRQPLVEPLAATALSRAIRRVRMLHPVAEAAEHTLNLLSPALVTRLRQTVTPAFVLELNIARITGELCGTTGAERYHDFVARFIDPGAARRFFSGYPLLAEMAATIALDWIAASTELALRLEDDRDLLAGLAGGEPLGALAEATPGTGDAHNSGRSVTVLSFSDGRKVVYKPRSLTADVAFQQITQWLCGKDSRIDLRRLKVCDRGSYGWCEFVAQAPVPDAGAAARFYRRTGHLLGLMYALRADDLHYENLIAHGEHPVVVDLESLCSPTPKALTEDPRETFWAQVGPSVLATGLLPVPVFAAAGRAGIDISGLGGRAGQVSGRSWPVIAAGGTDQARREWTSQPSEAASNQAVMHGEPLDPLDFADDIVDGFTECLGTLAAHRGEWLDGNGVLALLSQAEIRLIPRPSLQYAVLAEMLLHPDHLHDTAGREKVTGLLAPGPWGERSPAALVTSEAQQLVRGDIPYFTSRPDTVDARSCTGQALPDVLARRPIDQVRERIATLTPAQVAREAWTIRASLHVPALNGKPLRFPRHGLGAGSHPDRAALLAGATRIGDRLLELAIEACGQLRWLTVSSRAGEDWAVRDTEPDLYEGVAGIALFLGYLGEVVDAQRFRVAAALAVSTATERIDEIRGRGGGAFSGTGGLLYLLAHAAGWRRDPAMLGQAAALAEAVAAGREGIGHDVIGGRAGLILCLLNVYDLTLEPRLLHNALSVGDELIAGALPLRQGIGWRLHGPALTGFAHGNAGVAAALAALAARTGVSRHAEAAMRAVAYERTWFNARLGNWPDLRDIPELAEQADPEDGRVYLDAWCHGAPGIGLSRVMLLDHGIHAHPVRADLDAAVRTTLRQGFGDGHSLCHGDLGNLETLVAASPHLDDPALPAQISAMRSAVYSSILERPVCGTPYGLEVPGLLTGLAGIGYGLLRGACPDRVPDVLRLAPPPL